MLYRKQFLKFPPEKLNLRISPSTPNDIDNNNIQRPYKNRYIVSDDASNWMTDDDDDDEDVRPSPRRRNKELFIIQKQIELRVMRKIFEAQSDEVKRVIIRLHQMQINKRKVKSEQQDIKATAPRPLCIKRMNTTKQLNVKKRTKVAPSTSVGGATLQNNRKILARLQRRRHLQRKPKKQKKRKKFPRRWRRANAKSGNRQHRKRICRSQKYFNKGIYFTGRKLLEDIWKSIKDPNGISIDFRNNEFPGLSKLHLQQIAAYERIEEDLERLSITRQERTKAAEERKAKELEKAELRKDLENKIIAKAAAHAENDALRKERRAARKKRALDKKMRQQTAKAEIRLYCKNVV